MRKAKTTLSVLGIIFAAVAAILLLSLPVIDGLGARMTKGVTIDGSFLGDISKNLSVCLERAKAIPDAITKLFNSFNLSSKANLCAFAFVLCFALGTIAFVVTLVILCVKKHAKGLGLLIPLYIVALVALLVFGILFVNPEHARYIVVPAKEMTYVSGKRITAAGYICYIQEMKYFELALVAVIGISFAFIGLGFVLYMAYAIKLDKAHKEEAKAVEESKAEIKNLIKEALGK